MVAWYCWVSSLVNWHESTLVPFQRSMVQPTAGRPQCHEKLHQSIRTDFKHLIIHNIFGRLRFRLADSRLIVECGIFT